MPGSIAHDVMDGVWRKVQVGQVIFSMHQFEIYNADRALERGSDHNIKTSVIFFKKSGMMFSLIGNCDYVHGTVYT